MDYREYLLKKLKDPERSIGYLKAVIAENDPNAFLIAVKDVMEALSATHEIKVIEGWLAHSLLEAEINIKK